MTQRPWRPTDVTQGEVVAVWITFLAWLFVVAFLLGVFDR